MHESFSNIPMPAHARVKNFTVSKKVLIVRNCDNYFKYLTCSMMRNRREGDVKAGTHEKHTSITGDKTYQKHRKNTGT